MVNSKKKKYKAGLVIGRFQPFHKGHVYLFSKALALCDKIIIGIGSSNKRSKTNPWTPRQRREALKKFVEKNNLQSRVIKIVNLYDNPDDDVWFDNLIKKTGPFDVTIGNNDWNNGIIERHGIPAVKHGFLHRHIWEGVQIRDLMRKKKEWEERVPEYIVPLVKNSLQ